MITNRADFDSFLGRIHDSDVLQWAIAQRPNSDWVCEHVTNATFFINRIVHHPIGCVVVDLPDKVKNNKAVFGLVKDRYRKTTYNDNLCLFRCLALHLGREAAALYAEYTDTSIHDFAGVTIEDLHKVESKFKTNVVVYQLVEIADGKTTAELVRRSMAQYPETMYVNLHEKHSRSSKTYECIVIRGDAVTVNKRFGKVHGSCTVTNARARPVSFGYIKEAFIDRRHLCSNAWTMRASLSKTCYGITRIARRSTLNVFSPGITCPLTLIRYNGWHATYR